MPPILSSALLVAIGLAPSLVWLSFYLKKDCHPEPKYLVTKAFLMGIIISPLAILLQLGFAELRNVFQSEIFNQGSPSFFVWSSLVEEFLKSLAVYLVVLR